MSSRQGEGVEAKYKYLFVGDKPPRKNGGMEVGCESNTDSMVSIYRQTSGLTERGDTLFRTLADNPQGRRQPQHRQEDEGKGEKERRTWLMTVRRIRGTVTTGALWNSRSMPMRAYEKLAE